MMKRGEGCGGRGRGMGQQETVETSFFNKLVFTATTMPEYCLKHYKKTKTLKYIHICFEH